MSTFKIIDAIQTECLLAKEATGSEQAKHLYTIKQLALLIEDVSSPSNTSTMELPKPIATVASQSHSPTESLTVTSESDHSSGSLLDF
ncbi:hypothetical protein BFC20_12150 [Brochothrix thermosphacta]|uniref:hypothetical protein n=1 Tax=Brochothrix thermosphacta TaxID=2756 RepID=UPI000E769D6F|nr:hypothetical protein [Brochothrix thermosphacta]ANZ98398.1 hypothetical protein BFC20_12150 [Brochothrix thermosphacta]